MVQSRGTLTRRANTRRYRGSFSLPPTREPVEQTRPRTFSEWWLWGVEQAAIAAEVVVRLHDEDRPVGHAVRQPIIMGWPFSVGFERYLDAEWGKSPYRSAMASFYNPRDRGRAPQAHEFTILLAMVDGHTDPEVVRTVSLGGPHQNYFEDAATRALRVVWDRGEFMRTLAIETDGLPLELTEPTKKKKFSLLCDGTCGRADCAMDPPAPAGAA